MFGTLSFGWGFLDIVNINLCSGMLVDEYPVFAITRGIGRGLVVVVFGRFHDTEMKLDLVVFVVEGTVDIWQMVSGPCMTAFTRASFGDDFGQVNLIVQSHTLPYAVDRIFVPDFGVGLVIAHLHSNNRVLASSVVGIIMIATGLFLVMLVTLFAYFNSVDSESHGQQAVLYSDSGYLPGVLLNPDMSFQDGYECLEVGHGFLLFQEFETTVSMFYENFDWARLLCVVLYLKQRWMAYVPESFGSGASGNNSSVFLDASNPDDRPL